MPTTAQRKQLRTPQGRPTAMVRGRTSSSKGAMGVDFMAHLIVLDSSGIDVIMGMDWLSKCDGVIQCAKKSVLLTSPQGDRVQFVATMPSTAYCVVN